MLAIGDKAPDFSLPSHTGEKLSLKDFKGKTPANRSSASTT
mgnify:CR=1 FL=1